MVKTHISCPKCKELVSSEQVYYGQISCCPQCNEFFLLQTTHSEEHVPKQVLKSPNFVKSFLTPRQVLIPEHLIIKRLENGTLLIQSPWLRASSYFCLLVILIIDFILINLFVNPPFVVNESGIQVLINLFLTVCLIFSIVFTYLVIISFFNSTFIHVSRSRLHVECRPFWIPGGHTIASENIQQLFCHKNISTSRNIDGFRSKSISYVLYASLKDGQVIPIISAMELMEVRAMEFLIEQYLNIVDQDVIGEYSKDKEM